MSTLEIIVAIVFIILGIIVFVGVCVYPIISTLIKDKKIDDEEVPDGIDAKGR